MQLQISRAVLAPMTGGLLLAGCQSYEPLPLNLDAHRDAWMDRSPRSERVIAFARRLEEESGDPTLFDPSDGISLAEAEVIALVFNPDLRLARARGEITAATAAHAGLWEDPVFQIDVLRVTESVSSPWVVTPGLGFTIPLSGRLQAERSRADAAALAELYAIAEAEWSVRVSVRLAWFDWAAARLRLEETTDLERRLQSLVQSTNRLAEGGELHRTEAALFAIELAQRRNELVRLRREVAEGQLRIRGLLGLSPDAPIDLVPAVAIPAESLPPMAATPDNNLALARLRHEYEVAEHTLRLEILKQYPDLTIGPLYETDQGQSRIGFLGAIPLPILNANRQGIAEAEAGRALARAAFETEFERLVGLLAVARERAASVRAQRSDVESALIPLVDRQLEDTRQLLQIGEGGGLVLLESLVRAHETKLMLIELRRDESRAWTEISRMIGSEVLDPPRNSESEETS